MASLRAPCVLGSQSSVVWKHQIKRLRDLESENSKLKGLLADEMLEKNRIEGSPIAKVVKPAAKRRVVQFWIKTGLLSERHGCRLMEVSRSTVRYQRHGRDDVEMRARLKALAEKYPRYRYLTPNAMLRTEGVVRNHKHVYRILLKRAVTNVGITFIQHFEIVKSNNIMLKEKDH